MSKEFPTLQPDSKIPGNVTLSLSNEGDTIEQADEKTRERILSLLAAIRDSVAPEVFQSISIHMNSMGWQPPYTKVYERDGAAGISVNYLHATPEEIRAVIEKDLAPALAEANQVKARERMEFVCKDILGIHFKELKEIADPAGFEELCQLNLKPAHKSFKESDDEQMRLYRRGMRNYSITDRGGSRVDGNDYIIDVSTDAESIRQFIISTNRNKES